MAINVTEKAAGEVKRIISEEQAKGQFPEKVYLRVRVVGGGCSGFQNKLDLDPAFNDKLDELLQKVWGRRETHRDRTVDVFVRRLRQKVDRVASRHSFIQTRFGVGYKLEPVEK